MYHDGSLGIFTETTNNVAQLASSLITPPALPLIRYPRPLATCLVPPAHLPYHHFHVLSSPRLHSVPLRFCELPVGQDPSPDLQQRASSLAALV